MAFWERVITFAYEIFGIQYPRAAFVVGIVGSAMIGAFIFWFAWGFATKSHREAHPEGILMDRPDSEGQKQARTSLYEFFHVIARDVNRDAIEFTNDIHSQLGAGKGFGAKETIGGLLQHHAEEDFAGNFTALSAVIPPNSKEVSFVEVSRRFERFVCSYEKMVAWVQRAALLIPTTMEDKRYQQWNRTDVEFLKRLKETLAKRELDWLRQQVNGCRQSFRLRDGTK